MDSRDSDEAPRAAYQLGVLLEEQRDVEGARAAYQHAIDSGNRGQAPRATHRLALLNNMEEVPGA